MFDEVYLLDVAYETTGSIVKEGRYFELKDTDDGWQVEEKYLTEEQRSKLKFVNTDATGGAVFEIVKRVYALVENNDTVLKEDVLKIFQDIQISALPFEESMFDLVTSSTVFSDFLTLVQDYMMYVLYEKDASFFVNDTDVNKVLVGLNEKVGKHHIAETHRILKNTGRFYFSACVFKGEIYKPIGGNGAKSGEFLESGQQIRHLTREVTMPEDLKTLVPNYFRIKPEEQDKLNLWLWPGEDGENALEVQALILSKKEKIIHTHTNGDIINIPFGSQLLETVDNIYTYGSSVRDITGHLIFAIPDYLLNEGIYILNNRLNPLIRSEFKEGIVFGDDFKPHLYATSLVFLNRNDLRNIFIGNENGKVSGITLDGNIVLTRLARISNDTVLKNVTFKAAAYVGRGWNLENVNIERSILSDCITQAGEVLSVNLSHINIVGSYVGAGADIQATLLQNTVIPEGRTFEKETANIIGLMSEDTCLANYFEKINFDELDDGNLLTGLLDGEIRVRGSDIDSLPYSGRITSLATAFCILLQKGNQALVERYLYLLPEDVKKEIREKMSIVSIFVDSGLYEELNKQ